MSTEFTFMPDHQRQVVPVDKWVRVFFGGQAIADSRRPLLLLSSERTPVYLFPLDDVRQAALARSDYAEAAPARGAAGLGPASYWHVQAGGRTAENAARQYAQAPAEQARLRDHIALEWNLMDAWFEEGEQVYAHPADPFHRIDVRHSSRHVRVVIAGQTVAETRQPVLLFETGLPTRYYLPKTDVRLDLLAPSAKETWCAYKGKATHHSFQIGDQLVKDIAWSYPFPNPEFSKIQGLISFYNERLDEFYVDGAPVARAQTPWSS